MSIRYKSCIRRLALMVTFVSLALKFLIPVGYMPAAISDGWPVRMCHTGLPAGFLAHGEGHHEHHQADDTRWEACSFGVCCSPEVIADNIAVHALNAGEVPDLFAYGPDITNNSLLVFRSRAPPA